MSRSAGYTQEPIFSIILDSWTLLFEAGSTINGFVYIHFHGTNEAISFDSLCLYLKENVNLPQITASCRNLTSNILEKQVLLTRPSELYEKIVLTINQSKLVKIPFSLYLSRDLCASFNSNKIAVNHEIKVEFSRLILCSEICDLSIVQPIEIREIAPNYCSIGSSEVENQNEKIYDNKLGLLKVMLNKHILNFGDILTAKLSFQAKGKLSKGLLSFQLLQATSLNSEAEKTECVLYKTQQLIFMPENGCLEMRKSLPLIDPMILSQPTVLRNEYFKVVYIFRVSLEFRKRTSITDMELCIERRKSYLCDLKREYSETNIPLLPINLTVSDLKTDGLQSYVPLKNYYQNKRLLVKKGNLQNINALLTIVTNSCQPYEQNGIINGYVFLQLNGLVEAIELQDLYLILVGIRIYSGLESSLKGEMFLFKRLNLIGAKDIHAPVKNIQLYKKFDHMICEFEFHLQNIGISLLPTFESDNYRIAYELKAGLDKLKIGSTIFSLNTTLPVVITEAVTSVPLDNIANSGRWAASDGRYSLVGREVTFSCSIDRNIYHHGDTVQTRMILKNKTKQQLVLKLELIQLLEFFGRSNGVSKRSLSNPIIVLALPKSRFQTIEDIPLKNLLLNKQPTTENCKDFKVAYYLSVRLSVQSTSRVIEEFRLPLKIVRKYGHLNKRTSREGCPLLPLTLDVYDEENFETDVPNFLKPYSQSGLINISRNGSVTSQWSHWKISF